MIKSVLLAGVLAASLPTGLHRFDGVRLYLHCTGTGAPAIVLDSGLANDHGYWRGIERAAGTTRVCSWDRPGWGRSDRHPGRTITATQVVRDLHGLLRTRSARTGRSSSSSTASSIPVSTPAARTGTSSGCCVRRRAPCS